MIQIALNEKNERVLIDKSIKGTGKYLCPGCGEELIPRCGDINVWHFAHKSDSKCDWDADNDMSEFHRYWQGLFSEEEREIMVLTEDGKKKRADIKTKNGLFIEIQHSPISLSEMELREKVYGDMIWIIDSNISNSKVWKSSSKLVFAMDVDDDFIRLINYKGDDIYVKNEFIEFIRCCNYFTLNKLVWYSGLASQVDSLQTENSNYFMEIRRLKENIKYQNDDGFEKYHFHRIEDLKHITYLQEELQKYKNVVYSNDSLYTKMKGDREFPNI